KTMQQTDEPLRLLTWYIDPDRHVLRPALQRRTQKMLDDGLVEEVAGLIKAGVDVQSKPMQSIGYKEVVAYLNGEIKENELCDRIFFATSQYAKRQRTWFNKTEYTYKSTSTDAGFLEEFLR